MMASGLNEKRIYTKAHKQEKIIHLTQMYQSKQL